MERQREPINEQILITMVEMGLDKDRTLQVILRLVRNKHILLLLNCSLRPNVIKRFHIRSKAACTLGVYFIPLNAKTPWRRKAA